MGRHGGGGGGGGPSMPSLGQLTHRDTTRDSVIAPVGSGLLQVAIASGAQIKSPITSLTCVGINGQHILSVDMFTKDQVSKEWYCMSI